MKENNIEHQYLKLLKDILDNGVEKQDRTGTGTISVFGRQIRHDMKLGFPLLTTKKMPFKTIITELLWFLRGDTNIKFLVDNDCHIWNGDALKNYEKHNGEIDWGPFVTKEEAFVESMKDPEFAKKWGELGPIYGKQWRSWGGKKEKYQQKRSYGGSFGGPTRVEYGELVEYDVPGIDQIANLINDLKTNPDSRRLMVNAWNVGELDQMVLPPCHNLFQMYSVEKKGKRYLSLAWNQRSVDTFLGLPFNIASYGLLLEIIAKAVNMVPDELIGNLGDVHLYSNHIEQAKEQMIRELYPLPTLNINTEFWPYEGGECGVGPIDATAVFKAFKDNNFCKCLLEEDIQLANYQSHPTIKAPLSN